jgi:hypothetical protein
MEQHRFCYDNAEMGSWKFVLQRMRTAARKRDGERKATGKLVWLRVCWDIQTGKLKGWVPSKSLSSDSI